VFLLFFFIFSHFSFRCFFPWKTRCLSSDFLDSSDDFSASVSSAFFLHFIPIDVFVFVFIFLGICIFLPCFFLFFSISYSLNFRFVMYSLINFLVNEFKILLCSDIYSLLGRYRQTINKSPNNEQFLEFPFLFIVQRKIKCCGVNHELLVKDQYSRRALP
jgi:hypothetical protein